jgi:hypothetical protein
MPATHFILAQFPTQNRFALLLELASHAQFPTQNRCAVLAGDRSRLSPLPLIYRVL